MMDRGEGSWLFKAGTKWLDMLSGILNVSLGHNSDPVRTALSDVLQSGLINSYDRTSWNASVLVEMLGAYDKRYRWKLLNTGAEAIERAVQVVAHNIGRKPVVAVLPGSFHGKSLSMAGIRYAAPWGNPMGVVTIDLSHPETIPSFDMLIYEPISGWDGTLADEVALRKLCDANNAILVADEMITGFMRCGERFLNKSADIVVSGKGLSQGAPLSVLGVSSKLAIDISVGWNTTGGGNNLSAAIGLHTLHFLMHNESDIKDRVRDLEWNLQEAGVDRVYGALGFLDMAGDPAIVREVFEDAKVIASWHGKTLRVGPNFYMRESEFELFTEALKKAGEW